MYQYLFHHPQIFMSRVKEPNFFNPCIPHCTEDKYALLFADAGNAPVIGEASINYLCQEEAIRAMHAFNPEAKLLVMLRQPADFLHALHFANVQEGCADIKDFSAFIAHEKQAHAQGGGYLRQKIHAPLENLMLAFRLFGRQRVHVIILDEFTRDEAGLFRGLLSFLGVDEGYMPAFARHNSLQEGQKGVVYRSFRLNNQMYYMERLLCRLKTPYALVRLLRRGVNALNTRPVARSVMDAKTRAELTAYLEPYIAGVEEALGRPLPLWREDRSYTAA